MLNEYMLLVRNQKDHSDTWPVDRHREFLRACESYIARLRDDDRLIAAQPLVREGVVVSRDGGEWNAEPLASGHLQVGYYHVRAASLDDAIEIAKGNPEFVYSSTARVEVRPVKTAEPETDFVYPRSS